MAKLCIANNNVWEDDIHTFIDKNRNWVHSAVSRAFWLRSTHSRNEANADIDQLDLHVVLSFRHLQLIVPGRRWVNSRIHESMQRCTIAMQLLGSVSGTQRLTSEFNTTTGIIHLMGERLVYRPLSRLRASSVGTELAHECYEQWQQHNIISWTAFCIFSRTYNQLNVLVAFSFKMINITIDARYKSTFRASSDIVITQSRQCW